MKFIKSLRGLVWRLGTIAVLFFSPSVFADPCGSEFEGLMSEVMVDALETDPSKNSSLELYQEVFFVPVWVGEYALSKHAREMLRMIKEDESLSRTTNLYQKAIMLESSAKKIYAKENAFIEKVELEFELSELYKKYAEYRLYGSIDWAHFYRVKSRRSGAGWVKFKPKISPASLLENVFYHSGSLKEAFLEAEPKEYRFKALKEAFFTYLHLQKEHSGETIPSDRTIRPGKSDDLIPKIRERLRILGEYTGCEVEDLTYDSCLKESIVAFQKRHGLSPDGVIGKKTIKKLNMGIEERLALIKLNLDRIKWLNQRGDSRHIIINIPAFTLYFEENGALRLKMKVITGKRKNPTPVFSNTVQQIVLNPFWNVPKSIIQKEMIPQILENPNAMVEDGIDIYTGWGKNAQKIDAGSVDWTQYRYSKSMPFRFAQPPGYRNALGKIKFLFPNRFSVYMHDTPTKSLFKRTVRAFSHGCIRLEQPRELLKTFASFNESISFDAAEKRLRGNRRQYLKLDKPVPVDIVYLTAWVDYDGVLQFRNDIYGYDKIQLSKMKTW